MSTEGKQYKIIKKNVLKISFHFNLLELISTQDSKVILIKIR